MASATGPFVLLHVPESHPFRGERSQTLRFVLAFVFVSTNGGYLSHLERPVIMLGTSIGLSKANAKATNNKLTGRKDAEIRGCIWVWASKNLKIR